MKQLFTAFAFVLSLFSVIESSPANASGLNQQLLGDPTFLPVDEAFQYSAELGDKGITYHWKITEGYYLYKGRFKFKAANNDVKLGEPNFSKPGIAKQDPYFGEVYIFHDDVEVFLPVSAPSEAEIKVSYQGCAEAGLCYPPQRKTELFVPTQTKTVTPENTGSSITTPTSKGGNSDPASLSTTSASRDLDSASGIFQFIQNSSLLLTVSIFFLLGIGLTFTPCVFPMIPIITSIIAGQKQPTTGKSLALSSSYVLGMAITYAAAGVVTGMLGAGGNVQAALQNPWLLSIFAIVFVVLAFSMFGFYEIQLPAALRDRLNNTSQGIHGGYLGSVFAIGALSALIVSPCVSAPLAGALIYIGISGDWALGGASLFALGLGMGVPLILISVGGGKLMPKAGAWMDKVKAVFGVGLIAVAISLLSRIIPESVTLSLWALLIAICAAQLGAFEPATTGWQKTFKGTGLLLAFYAATLMIGSLTGAKDALSPLAAFTRGSAIPGTQEATAAVSKVEFVKVTSIPQLEQEIARARQLNKPVMLDFYADWCISCKIMESELFPQPGISQKMAQFHLVQADVTENSDENKALLDKFKLFGPPSILFFNPKGKEIESERIMGELNEEQFSKRLTQALAQSSV